MSNQQDPSGRNGLGPAFGRTISSKPNNVPWICLAVVVVLVVGVISLKPGHRTHSGGDFMVPSFANGGSYADGTRRAHFNRNNNLAYDPYNFAKSSGVQLPLLVFCVLLALVITYLSKSTRDSNNATNKI
uniref:Triple gene block protein 2 n=1 Tax=Fern benyvirus TaxID=2933169 RepID=A0A9C7LLY6_9VIRU|nr:triple gene block protein 2 [Fern benyvirus]CAI5383956.1 triple gene block protein 2 [Fern benyvirus]